MVSNITNMNPYSYSFSSGGAAGKLFVPVNPSAVIYAQFDHISGIAAPRGQSGVSISKIQILNALIENLSRIKAAPKESRPAGINDKQADVLIEQYQKQIAKAVQADAAQFALNGARPDVGAVVSLNA